MNAQAVKQEFRIVLRPMMELFDHKKTTLSPTEWSHFVQSTMQRIILNPEQFLGRELPTDFVIRETVNEIFADYLAEDNFIEA